MITILKNTTKLVTDVPFPALTLCASGLHMNQVEKKLVKDFRNWREEKHRNGKSMEEIKKDMEEFMLIRFQIQPSQEKGGQPMSILNILDTMIAPNADASATKSVSENVVSCKQSAQNKGGNRGCTYSCSDPNFKLLGKKCFYVSTTKASNPKAVEGCQEMNAVLATVSSLEEDEFISTLEGGVNHIWIGLNRLNREIEGPWVWQDGSPDTFTNWAPNRPEGNGDCAGKAADYDGKWNDAPSNLVLKYACTMKALESCDSPRALEEILQTSMCATNSSLQEDMAPELPAIDIFLNPAKEVENEAIISETKIRARNFFKNSDMKTL